MVGDIFSGVAALAALVTVLYARATVVETRRNREEEAVAHREAMAREGEILQETRTAHEREMAARERAVERELWLQRLVQLGRVQELLGNVVETAASTLALRVEAGSPLTVGVGDTRVPSALLRAEVGIAILEQLGGPSLPEFLKAAQNGRRAGAFLQEIESEAARALNTVRALAEDDPSLSSAPIAAP